MKHQHSLKFAMVVFVVALASLAQAQGTDKTGRSLWVSKDSKPTQTILLKEPISTKDFVTQLTEDAGIKIEFKGVPPVEVLKAGTEFKGNWLDIVDQALAKNGYQRTYIDKEKKLVVWKQGRSESENFAETMKVMEAKPEQTGAISLNFSEPTTRVLLIDDIAKGLGYAVVYNGLSPKDMGSFGPVQANNLKPDAALELIFEGSGAKVSVDDEAKQITITPAISPLITKARTVDLRCEAIRRMFRPPYKLTDDQVKELCGKYPDAFSANGTYRDPAQLNALNEELYALRAQMEFQARPAMASYDTVGYARPPYPYAATDGYYWFWNIQSRIWELKIKGASTHGFLKINALGDSKFAKYLMVLRRDEQGVWRIVGGGASSFRSFQNPLELPVGKWRLRFEERHGGKTKYLEEEFEIESKYDFEHPIRYSISSEMMKSFAQTEEIARK